MRWQIKWLKNAAFGVLPWANSLRRIKRRLRPYPTDIPPWTLEEGFRLLELLREADCELHDRRVLEIGSGWRPIIPLLFSLAGARVVMTDSQQLMDGPTFAGTVAGLAMLAPQIAVRLKIDEADVRTALAEPSENLVDSLRRFRLEYCAPTDIVADPPPGSFDIVMSRAVLEHVPPAVLQSLLAAAFRLLRPGGWTVHAVDNSDHWSHGDPRLSRIHFLRYSEKFFGLLNSFNPLDYQNRLRHPQYVELLKAVGFVIDFERSTPEVKALADLKSLPIAEIFRGFSHDDLARLDSYLLARRPG